MSERDESTNPPDFESMTPEELMKWVESMAVSYSADGIKGLEKISEDDERLSGKSEYVPNSLTKEKLQEHLRREKEQKAQEKPSTSEEVNPPESKTDDSS